MKRKLKIYGGIALGLLLILTLLLQIDDSIDSEAAQWIERANSVEDIDGNAFYFLMGLNAAADEDPENVGQILIAGYRKAEADYESGASEDLVYFGYPAGKSLPEPGGEYYCQLRDKGCYSRLAGNIDVLERELQQHSVLLSRYQRYFEFETMRTVLKPSYNEPLPPYRFLLLGNKLYRFKIMADHAAGNYNDAIKALYRDIDRLRHQLTLADTLILKMVLIAMLAEDLDLLANISDFNNPLRSTLDLLTADERSVYLPMAREFAALANMSALLDENADFFRVDFPTPGWAVRLVFKPNMTINTAFPRFQTAHELALLTPAEFKTAAEQRLSVPVSSFSLRNALGKMLLSISLPGAYRDYLARLFDLDCKIALVNAALPLSRQQWDAMLEHPESNTPVVVNPYDETDRAFVIKDKRALCLGGPFEDNRDYRCVARWLVAGESHQAGSE